MLNLSEAIKPISEMSLAELMEYADLLCRENRMDDACKVCDYVTRRTVLNLVMWGRSGYPTFNND